MNNSFPNAAKAMTFIVIRDRENSKAFYRDTIGFTMTYEDAFAAVFDLNGTALRVVNFAVYDGMGQDNLGIWSPPGSSTKVAWFLDPDGNNLSITQF
jgi:hypothetical protein